MILETLQELRHGAAVEELDEAVQEVVRAVRETGKQGTVTLTLKVSPLDSTGGTVKLTDDLKVRAPQLPKGETIMFTTGEGALSRRDPRQVTIPGTGEDESKVRPFPQPREGGAGDEG